MDDGVRDGPLDRGGGTVGWSAEQDDDCLGLPESSSPLFSELTPVRLDAVAGGGSRAEARELT